MIQINNIDKCLVDRVKQGDTVAERIRTALRNFDFEPRQEFTYKKIPTGNSVSHLFKELINRGTFDGVMEDLGVRETFEDYIRNNFRAGVSTDKNPKDDSLVFQKQGAPRGTYVYRGIKPVKYLERDMVRARI